MQVRLYMFEDTTSPPILLLYAASERLGIIEFKVPNEAILTAAIDTISTKKVTFSTPFTHQQNQTPRKAQQCTIEICHKKQAFSRPFAANY